MYSIELTSVALDDLRWFPKYEQREILENTRQRLQYEPLIKTRNRKPMRPNATADWELRIRHFRVLYTVDETNQLVEIQRIGEKHGNQFFFRGSQEDIC